MRIAIIGAGAAGLAALRRCVHFEHPEFLLEVVAYEKSDRIGGTWVYVPETGKDAYGLPIHSSMYDSLRTNLPKEVMGYPSFQIPEKENSRSYLSRTEILEFLENFATHHNIRQYIKFSHNVELVEPELQKNGEERWRLLVRNLPDNKLEEEYFDGVLVCNGHYFEPLLPSIKGREKFKGEQLHSHDYRLPEPFANKRVVIIGAGPSGLDLTLETAKTASFVFLSHHSADAILTQFPSNVVQKPDIVEIKENSVVFKDNSEEPIDVIFYCTGYKYSFPFLSDACDVKVDSNMVTPLWKHVLSIMHPAGLAFIGLPYYVCAFSMFDLQVQFVLEFWMNRQPLPDRNTMLLEEAEERKERFEVRGFTKRQFHMMGPLQGAYYDDLADAAKLPRLPPVLTKMHNHSSERFLEDLVHYREDRYKVIDNNTFALLAVIE